MTARTNHPSGVDEHRSDVRVVEMESVQRVEPERQLRHLVDVGSRDLCQASAVEPGLAPS